MEKNINETIKNTVNIDDKVNSFGRKLGNGIGAGSDLAEIFNHVVNKGRDTTPIVGAINKAKAKKDSQAEKNIRLTLGAIYKDAEIITPKGKSMIIKIKGIKADAKALERLTKLVTDGVSIRGSKWANDIRGNVVTTKPTALTTDDYKKKAIALVKAGYSGTALAAAISEVIKENAAKKLSTKKKAA